MHLIFGLTKPSPSYAWELWLAYGLWTFHNLSLLVSSFRKDVVKRCETSQILLMFGQSLWKLWCRARESKPTLCHPLSEPAAGRNGPTQRPGWTHSLMHGHWAPREQQLAGSEQQGAPMSCTQHWPGTAGWVKDTAPACPLNFLAS